MKDKIIELLSSIIHSERTTEVKVNFHEVYPLFRFHHLEPFLEYARQRGLLIIKKEEEQELRKIYQTSLYKMATQEEELSLIKKTLIENQIFFLPIKGSLIRRTYPSPDLRTMADLDILVKKQELKKVKKLMLSLGYIAVHEGGNHDVYHKLPFMNVEIHRQMIDESYVLSRYYQDIWNKVKRKDDDSSELSLSDEDNYLFLIAHSAKHFYNGGTGIRSVLDIYFYLKFFPKMNEDYLKEELHKLNLYNYEERLRKLALGWFDNQEMSLEEVNLGTFIIKSGVYGVSSNSHENNLMIDQETKSLRYRKFRYYLVRAFPPFKTMKSLFPILKTFPIILPLCYGIRLLKGLFTGKAVKQIKSISKIKDEDIKKNQSIKEKTRG